jgi:hypothetical protein
MDIQGAETQLAMSKSEGQLLEDIEKVGSMVTSVSFSPLGRPVSMSPSDDDPLVSQKAVEQLRRERSLRPSHVVDGAAMRHKSIQVKGLNLRGLVLGQATSLMEAAMNSNLRGIRYQ